MSSLAGSAFELWMAATAASAGLLTVVVTVQSGLARARRTARGARRARRGVGASGTT